MYTIERIEKTIGIPEYVERFVDVDTFLAYCKDCSNYEQVWSCPTYDFDPKEFWLKFKTVDMIGIKFVFTEETKAKFQETENMFDFIDNTVNTEKRKLRDELMALEGENEGSFALLAGPCDLCTDKAGNRNCLRPNCGLTFSQRAKSCRFPDKVRFSFESIGADVMSTSDQLLGLPILWIANGILPDYLTFFGGLLKK